MAPYTKPPLDESLYKTDDAELAFIQEQSGIRDRDALKRHIVAVQVKAYDHYPYRCIQSFAFTRTKISRLPAYQHVLTLARERADAILLDLGCCFGIDVRKAVSDGFPAENVLASDLRPDFWKMGHELFRSTPATCPIAFLAGDALDPDFLEPAAPCTSPHAVPAPPLASLTRLTALHGHVAALHVSAVFHLFREPQQLQLARALAGLLSPLPGSVIFGAHGGRRAKGERDDVYSGRRGHPMFCHSPESWGEMWREVFPPGTVRVDAQLKSRDSEAQTSDEEKSDEGLLVWSVTRVRS
ncbi:hypothetical protein DFH09DRAFT_1156173 [Mycena vulgaris]|nr:hypothetical protein DFH09DRAFT_1225676 [Mycena vulgaris]KAJ6567776.1 hypothetical protein DFH09DRAFT_1156173 [Mycena vulgaris]